MPMLSFLRRGLALLASSFFAVSAAHAVPSYARQTGSECGACHVGGFGPQLTPFGMQFKLGGYADSDGKDNNRVPLSGMVVANRTHTAAPLEEWPDHFKSNNNTAMQEASVFLAGKLWDNVGAFVQQTYSGVERKWSLDQLDLRYARLTQIAGREATVGLSLNNNPTLTDPLNTLGQWHFPYTESDFGHGLGSAPLVESVGGSVLGVNAYTLWDKHWYGELGLYGAMSHRAQRLFNAADIGRLRGGPALYGRFAYMVDRKRDNFSAGLVGMRARLQPDRTSPDTEGFTDLGIDASYQYLGNRENIYTLNASWIHENRNSLNNLRVAGSYTWRQTWGMTLGHFDARGKAGDSTSGQIVQVDWTPWGKEASWGAPWANLRLGLQYTGYNRFTGSATPRDMNTTMLFGWVAL